MVREWLSSSGTFNFGKHRGFTIEDVARSDPGYLRWIISEVEDIDDEDRKIMEIALKTRGKDR